MRTHGAYLNKGKIDTNKGVEKHINWFFTLLAKVKYKYIGSLILAV